MTTAVSATGLTKQFGSRRALEDVTFQVAEGEITALLGPNGAGKTTTVRLLNGVLAPTKGSAKVLGYKLPDQALEVRARSGVVTETLTLYERLTGRYNLQFYGSLYGLSPQRTEERIAELASFFQLAGYIDDLVETYSTGMKKKLSLARALLHEPTILFLDEPTTGLDPESAHSVVEYVGQLSRQEGRTIFLCTHNLDVAETLASQVMLLDAGRLVASGSLEDLRKRLWPDIEVEISCQVPSSEGDELRRLRQIARVVESSRSLGSDGLARLVCLVAERGEIPRLVQSLVELDYRIFGVSERKHSLEDVYFQLRGHRR